MKIIKILYFKKEKEKHMHATWEALILPVGPAYSRMSNNAANLFSI